MSMKYVHTCIVSKDCKALSAFYQKVFGCKPVPPKRDLKGDWVDKLTGIKDAHIIGEHLALPGYGGDLPTLEIFTYNNTDEHAPVNINHTGLTHLAFIVDNVEETLAEIKREGGSQLGEIVCADYPDNKTAVFVYARDIDGNIIELQSWK